MAWDWNPDEGVRPALLDETTRGAGSDSPAAGGGWGAELDPVIPTLFPKDGPVSGVAMKHRGVTPAEEERMEFWKEGAGGGKVELHTGFLDLTHCNNRPLVSDAAEEGRMVLLEEVRSYVPERGGRRIPPRDQEGTKGIPLLAPSGHVRLG